MSPLARGGFGLVILRGERDKSKKRSFLKPGQFIYLFSDIVKRSGEVANREYWQEYPVADKHLRVNYLCNIVVFISQP